MPPLVSSHFPNQFFRTLQQFRESRYLCDVRLIADGEIEFPAHRLVLAISSPFFSDLFQSKKDSQDVTTVHLRNCSADCVQILLQFLYSGELQLKQCDPGKVLSVARACRIGALEQMLSSYSSNSASPPPASSSPASGGLQLSTSPKQSPTTTNDSIEMCANSASPARHSQKRKSKSNAVAGEQRQQQQPTKTETRKTTNKASSFQTQQTAASSLLNSSGASRPDVQTVPTPTSIFMQNGPSICPIHGVFACGCPLFAMAAANGTSPSNHHPGAPESAMAAAYRLFFGAAAAAAAAAQAAEMANDRSSDSKDEEGGSISGVAYGATLPKIARMTNNKASGNGPAGFLLNSQNGERHCHLPTTPADVAQQITAQGANCQADFQHQTQILATSTTAGGLSNSATKHEPSTPDSQTHLVDSAEAQQQTERGSLSTVQVPADDKEGWCRNKKYIKKTPQGYQCTVCKKTYGRYNSVSYHVTIYHRNPPIQCDQPGCTFSTREARYIHFHKYYRHDVALPTNIDLESRRCPFCKHVAKSPAMLEKHINRHMPECIRVGRTYHCDLCKKELASRHALVQHMMIHENEKGLSCDQCSYRGRTAENLQQHKLFKHSNAGDLWCAKYHCGECQFSTPSKSQLAAHQLNVHKKESSPNVATNTSILTTMKSYSDTEGEERCDSDNGNKLSIGEDDARLHSDTDEEIGDGHDEFAIEQDEEGRVSNDDASAYGSRPSGSEEIEDEQVTSSNHEEAGGSTH